MFLTMKRASWTVAVAALACLALASCGGSGGDAEYGAGGPSAAPVTIDPATAGSVSGRVLYEGPDPEPARIDMGADPACAERQPEPVYSQEVALGADRALRNALVWIKAGAPAGRYPVPSTKAVLDQSGCLYEPRVLAVMIGQGLEIRNGDATMHNVHVRPVDNREWNRSQVSGGTPIEESFAREEIGIPFRCNVHPWMRAYVSVLRHPFFSVTGEDGRFAISGLPPGEYTLAVWHEKLGTQERRLTIAAQASVPADFTLSAGGV